MSSVNDDGVTYRKNNCNTIEKKKKKIKKNRENKKKKEEILVQRLDTLVA